MPTEAERRKEMVLELGKRYGVFRPTGKLDDDGNPIRVTVFEILCIKPGECTPTLGEEPLEIVPPKVLPSAD